MKNHVGKIISFPNNRHFIIFKWTKIIIMLEKTPYLFCLNPWA